MKKRIITMILTLTMLLSLCIPAMAADTETNAGFTDVSPGAWYADAVEYVTTHKLFAGTSDTTFAPNAPMTRGMFVTVLARMAGVKEASIINNHAFVDNNFGSWYGPSVEWGYENGFINGVSADSFLPNQNLTREQMAVIIYRFLNRLGVEMQDSPTATKSFADAAKVSGYAKVAVDEMRRIGFLNGSNGYVDPLRNITRAEAATFFMRVDSFLDSYTGSVGLALSNTAVTMPSGYVAQLYAYTVPEGVADNIIWASADSRIATVDANGIVTGRAEGTVTVTALTQTGYAAACSVTITKGNDTPAPEIPTDSEITNVKLSATSLEMTEGDTKALTASVLPTNATDKTVHWGTNNGQVAVVKQDGTIVAKSAGTAIITATAGNVSASCTVTVKAKYIDVDGVTLSQDTAELKVNGSIMLTATVSPANATEPAVTWSAASGNIEIKDNKDGTCTVTAKAAGEAVVTATAGKKSAVCTIKVLEKDTGNATFTVEQAEFNLSVAPFMGGQAGDIKPTCNHKQSNSSDSFNDIVYGPGNWYRNIEDHFTFESSDTSVITVNEKGWMEYAALPNDSAPRTAYVTVTHKADGTTLKVKVTVSIGEQYYEVNDDYIAAYAAEMLKLVNEARREAGLTDAVYSSDPISQATVNARAEELKTKYSHNRPNGETITDLQREMGCTERWGGENIAMVGFNYMEVDGCLYTPNKPETEARYFFNLWMSDIGHRKEILLPVDNNRMVCGLHVGKGNIYAVQWFGVVD